MHYFGTTARVIRVKMSKGKENGERGTSGKRKCTEEEKKEKMK